MSVRLKKLQSETIRLINETTTNPTNQPPSSLSLIKKRLASPITSQNDGSTSSTGLLSPSGVQEVLNILA